MTMYWVEKITGKSISLIQRNSLNLYTKQRTTINKMMVVKVVAIMNIKRSIYLQLMAMLGSKMAMERLSQNRSTNHSMITSLVVKKQEPAI